MTLLAFFWGTQALTRILSTSILRLVSSRHVTMPNLMRHGTFNTSVHLAPSSSTILAWRLRTPFSWKLVLPWNVSGRHTHHLYLKTPSSSLSLSYLLSVNIFTSHYVLLRPLQHHTLSRPLLLVFWCQVHPRRLSTPMELLRLTWLPSTCHLIHISTLLLNPSIYKRLTSPDIGLLASNCLSRMGTLFLVVWRLAPLPHKSLASALAYAVPHFFRLVTFPLPPSWMFTTHSQHPPANTLPVLFFLHFQRSIRTYHTRASPS
jgi:hypothetical protein